MLNPAEYCSDTPIPRLCTDYIVGVLTAEWCVLLLVNYNIDNNCLFTFVKLINLNSMMCNSHILLIYVLAHFQLSNKKKVKIHQTANQKP